MNITKIFNKIFKPKEVPIEVSVQKNIETPEIMDIDKILNNLNAITPYELIIKINKLNREDRTIILNNPLIKEKLKYYILEQYSDYKDLTKLKQKLTVVEIISLLDIQTINEEYNDNEIEKYKIFRYICMTKEETLALINYLLTNNELFLEFSKDVTFYKEVFSYLDYNLIIKIILKLNELKAKKYLYYFITYLSSNIQKKLIDAKLDDNLLVLIADNFSSDSINYLFQTDKRTTYLFTKLNIKRLLDADVILPENILNDSKFFDMLKEKSLISFRTNINNVERKNLPEPIEYQLKKYYEELISSYNHEYNMFNDYVNIINTTNKLNNEINFNNYILDFNAKNIYKEYLKKKDPKIFEEYKILTSKKLSEIIIDALFQDNIYNVFYNIKEMFRFNNKLSPTEQILDTEKQKFYKLITNIDKITNEDKIKLYYEYKDKNINLMFYEDLRKLKDKSYELINSKLFNYTNYNPSKILSLKYKTQIYDLRNKEFFMLIRGEENHQEKTTTRINCYSIISNDNTDVFCNGTTTLYGYNYLDTEKVLHVHERDSYSYDLNEKVSHPRIKINRIMTAEELSNGCSWYSEIQIINSKDNGSDEEFIAKKPDFIVSIDEISKSDIYESQRLQIPIVLIKRQLLEIDKMVDIDTRIDYEDEYVNESSQEVSQGRAYRLK